MDESPGVWGRTQSFVKGQPPPHDKKEGGRGQLSNLAARAWRACQLHHRMDVDQELGSEDLGDDAASQAACSWGVACPPYHAGLPRPKGESDRPRSCHFR